MADNVQLNAATTSGATIRTDDVGSSVQVPVSKIVLGADGVDGGFVSSANPLPVSDAGGSLTVDVGTALPAGTNAIGKLAANSGVDIGDVDVTSVTPGTAAASLGKAEDAAHASGDTGVMALTVRQDTAAALSGTDGDYQPPITDGSGRLWVNASGAAVPVTDNSGSLSVDDNGSTLSVDDGGGSLTVDGTVGISGTVPVSDGSGSLTVDNAGTFAVQESGGALTALQVIDDWDESDRAKINPIVGQAGVAAGAGAVGATTQRVTLASDDPAVTSLGLLDDAVKTDDAAFTPATDKVLMVGAQLDNSSPDSVDEGDAGALRMSANRALHTVLRDAAGNERGANVNANSELLVKHTDAIPVTDNSGSLTVDNGGTFATQESGAALTALQLIDDVVLAEDAAHSSGDKGVMALTVRRDTAAATAGTDGDYQPPTTDASGRLWVNASGAAVPVTDNSGSLTVDGTVTAANAAGDVAHDGVDSGNPVKIGAQARSSEQTAVASADRVNLIADLVGKLITLPYANPENFLSGVTTAITDTSNTSVIAAQGAGVRIYVTHLVVANSHATVSTIVEIKDGTTVIYRVPAAAVNGGAVLALPVPLRLTANTALQAACVTTGANVYVSASGYKGA